MCTGRVDLAFIFRAYSKGADGVIIGGCWPGECHYVTEGNYDALANVYIAKKILGTIGVSMERLRIEWISASEGTRFADIMNEFVEEVTELGQLGKGENIADDVLARRLEAVQKNVPYIKLVERERLRVSTRSEKAYLDYFSSEEADLVYRELIADNIMNIQVQQVLMKRPLSKKEISESLGISPFEASRHLTRSSRQGFIRYDTDSNCFKLAKES